VPKSPQVRNPGLASPDWPRAVCEKESRSAARTPSGEADTCADAGGGLRRFLAFAVGEGLHGGRLLPWALQYVAPPLGSLAGAGGLAQVGVPAIGYSLLRSLAPKGPLLPISVDQGRRTNLSSIRTAALAICRGQAKQLACQWGAWCGGGMGLVHMHRSMQNSLLGKRRGMWC